MNKPAIVKCPTCRQKGKWFAGAFGPFCSRRCKLVDLGKWFGEAHHISSRLRPEPLEELDDYAKLPTPDEAKD
jgi:uncharacterized protein